MKKIESIDKNITREIREALNPIIAKFMADNYGLTASLGNASLTDKSIDFKLHIKAEGVSDLDKKYAELYQWPALGTTFRNGGRTFEVVEYDRKRRAKPIVCKDVATDKRYIFNPEDVKKLAV